MPPRLATRLAIPPRFTPQPCIPRAFHATPRQCADFASKNHYERLNIRHDASPGEIKKSFYSLSKSHHPDVNRSDPHAAHTFSLLSESYTVLSDPSRRAQYDRDTLRLGERRPGPGPNPGGRSPSGLSRRRGSFRGPPPSFYRNGGWGAQGEKRRKAHEESSSSSSTQSESQSQSRYGGMGPGSNPFGATDRRDDSVPHFDTHGHTRTHRREDERRRWRRRRAMGDDDVEFEPQTSLGGHFLIVAGILGATFVAPLVYLQVSRLGRQERDKG
ncbi:hypothetical protein C2857_004722 [Epichloe festucae Fl1]|uniref:J domain-containing protein n=1 Tax=Epichloe festucae (strain Fl1) TaxID=877507 RepID=A0A7S9KP80_EPIFF|nr:hypothetical protein C2857_004722 [Epichloe festucae Fl1]